MLAKPAQLEMADLKDRFGNFDGESIGHQQWPADILAKEFQPTKDVDVPPDNTEIETIARANIAVGGNAVVQSDIDGNMLLNLRWCALECYSACNFDPLSPTGLTKRLVYFWRACIGRSAPSPSG